MYAKLNLHVVCIMLYSVETDDASFFPLVVNTFDNVMER
jgi:hypothetical protein